MQYFEDIRVGAARESSESYELTKDEIVEFCSKWDPLPFHVDEAAGAKSQVGKLFTSAIHSIAIAIRLGHEMSPEPTAVVAGLGWDNVRFHVPACVGDRLKLRGKVIETRESKSNPDVGIIRNLLELINQDGDTVVSFTTAALIERRPETQA